jgi:hypothetical protein
MSYADRKFSGARGVAQHRGDGGTDFIAITGIGFGEPVVPNQQVEHRRVDLDRADHQARILPQALRAFLRAPALAAVLLPFAPRAPVGW